MGSIGIIEAKALAISFSHTRAAMLKEILTLCLISHIVKKRG